MDASTGAEAHFDAAYVQLDDAAASPALRELFSRAHPAFSAAAFEALMVELRVFPAPPAPCVSAGLRRLLGDTDAPVGEFTPITRTFATFRKGFAYAAYHGLAVDPSEGAGEAAGEAADEDGVAAAVRRLRASVAQALTLAEQAVTASSMKDPPRRQSLLLSPSLTAEFFTPTSDPSLLSFGPSPAKPFMPRPVSPTDGVASSPSEVWFSPRALDEELEGVEEEWLGEDRREGSPTAQAKLNFGSPEQGDPGQRPEGESPEKATQNSLAEGQSICDASEDERTLHNPAQDDVVCDRPGEDEKPHVTGDEVLKNAPGDKAGQDEACGDDTRLSRPAEGKLTEDAIEEDTATDVNSELCSDEKDSETEPEAEWPKLSDLADEVYKENLYSDNLPAVDPHELKESCVGVEDEPELDRRASNAVQHVTVPVELFSAQELAKERCLETVSDLRKGFHESVAGIGDQGVALPESEGVLFSTIDLTNDSNTAEDNSVAHAQPDEQCQALTLIPDGFQSPSSTHSEEDVSKLTEEVLETIDLSQNNNPLREGPGDDCAQKEVVNVDALEDEPLPEILLPDENASVRGEVDHIAEMSGSCLGQHVAIPEVSVDVTDDNPSQAGTRPVADCRLQDVEASHPEKAEQVFETTEDLVDLEPKSFSASMQTSNSTRNVSQAAAPDDSHDRNSESPFPGMGSSARLRRGSDQSSFWEGDRFATGAFPSLSKLAGSADLDAALDQAESDLPHRDSAVMGARVQAPAEDSVFWQLEGADDKLPNIGDDRLWTELLNEKLEDADAFCAEMKDSMMVSGPLAADDSDAASQTGECGAWVVETRGGRVRAGARRVTMSSRGGVGAGLEPGSPDVGSVAGQCAVGRTRRTSTGLARRASPVPDECSPGSGGSGFESPDVGSGRRLSFGSASSGSSLSLATRDELRGAVEAYVAQAAAHDVSPGALARLRGPGRGGSAARQAEEVCLRARRASLAERERVVREVLDVVRENRETCRALRDEVRAWRGGGGRWAWAAAVLAAVVWAVGGAWAVGRAWRGEYAPVLV